MLLSHARAYILTRSDGLVMGFTEHDRPLVVDGEVCSPVGALVASTAEQGIGSGIDTVDVSAVFDAARITRVDVAAGLWDGAELRLFVYDWRSREIVREFLTYQVADCEWQGAELTVRLESKGSATANRKTGIIGAPSCGWRFGDSNCGVDRTANRTTAKLTAIDGIALTLAVPDPAAGQWQGGRVVWGDETAEIVLASATALYLASPFATPPEPGDTLILEPGCGKTTGQCRTFDNFARFGGHGHRAPNASTAVIVADSQDGQEFDGGSRFTE